MPSPIYFDHAAATPVAEAVLAAWPELARTAFANPESIHQFAYDLRRRLRDAEAVLSTALLGRARPVIWAASGAELFNLVAALPALAGRDAAIDAMAHPALAAAFGRTMRVAPRATDRTALHAVTHVQSELGLFGAVPETADGVLFLDTIQSAGKLVLPPGADFYTVSGHKLGAPGGAALVLGSERAAAWLGEFQRLRSVEYRVGRPEAVTALALALAVDDRVARRPEELPRIAALNAFLRAELGERRLPNRRKIHCTIPAEQASVYVLHLLLPGYQGAVVTRLLAQRGVGVSSGSACQAESDRPSAALLALGYPAAEAWSGLRLSFGSATVLEEAERFVGILDAVLRDY